MSSKYVAGSLTGWVIIRHLIPEKEVKFDSSDDYLVINTNRLFYNKVEIFYNGNLYETYRYAFRVKGEYGYGDD